MSIPMRIGFTYQSPGRGEPVRAGMKIMSDICKVLEKHGVAEGIVEDLEFKRLDLDPRFMESQRVTINRIGGEDYPAADIDQVRIMELDDEAEQMGQHSGVNAPEAGCDCPTCDWDRHLDPRSMEAQRSALDKIGAGPAVDPRISDEARAADIAQALEDVLEHAQGYINGLSDPEADPEATKQALWDSLLSGINYALRGLGNIGGTR